MKQRKQFQLSKRQGTGGSTLSRRLAYMLLLFVTFFAGGSSAWAEDGTVTFTATKDGFTESPSSSGISITTSVGFDQSNGYNKISKDATISVTPSDGKTITEVVFTHTSSNSSHCTSWTLGDTNKNASEIVTFDGLNATSACTFTAGGSARLKSVTVTYTTSSDPDPTPAPKYTLTFGVNPTGAASISAVLYGTETSVQSGDSFEEGTKITITPSSANPGYTRILGANAAWTGSNNTETNEITWTMGTSNKTLTANFRGNVITFNTDGGNTIEPKTYAGSAIELPTPTKDGYTFDGWYNGENKITETSYTPLTDITLTAHWTANTPDPEPQPIAGAEVWFAYQVDVDNAGTTQSTIFKNANDEVMTAVAKKSGSVTGSIEVNGTTYSVTGRGSNATINVKFTVPTGKTGTLYGLASSSGKDARPLTLTSDNYSDATQATGDGSSTTAGAFTYTNLLPGDYVLTSNGSGAVEFLYLALQGASNPVITTQPQGATYEYNATATALTVGATATAGGALSYQWYKSANADGSNATVVGTEASYTPATNAVGTSYYYCVVTEAGGGNVKSDIATVVVNKAKNTLAVSSNNVTIIGTGSITVTYTSNSDAAVVFTSNGTGIATVLAGNETNGIVITGVAAGNTTITLSQVANANYEASDIKTINVTVVEEGESVETVFYRDFTDANWADAKFKQGNTNNVDVNYNVTTNGKSSDTGKNYSIDVTGLKTPNNNTSDSNYYIEIPVEKLNGKVSIVVNELWTSVNAKLYNSDGTVVSGASVEKSKTANEKVILEWTVPETFAGGYLRLGRGEGNGTQLVKSILVTTPTPDNLSAPSNVSVSAEKSTVYTNETVTLTATATDAYSYKWYSNSSASTDGGTELYGETIHELKVTPTEVGTYYYYCKAVNSKGETVSTNCVTITVTKTPVIPVLAFTQSSKAYNKNTSKWDEEISPVLTIGPSDIDAATLATLLSSVVYTTSDPNIAYSATNGVGSLTKADTQGTGFKVTATLTISDVEGVVNGTYTASFSLDIIDGYADKLGANFTPEVGGTREVLDDDGNVVLTLGFGGWTHGSNGTTWYDDGNGDTENTGAKVQTDSWPKTSEYGGTHDYPADVVDGYSYQSQADTDARSETKDNIEWITESQLVKPYSLPCRGDYITVTPEKNGVLTIYLVQNGCVNETGDNKDKISGSPRTYYWFDSEGNCIPSVPYLTQKLQFTKSTNPGDKGVLSEQIKSSWGVDLEEESATAADKKDLRNTLLAHWANKGKDDVEEAIPYKGGYFLMKKAYIKYTLTLLAGKTYYFFSNASKMGYAGLNFAPSHDGTVEIGLPQGGTETVNTVEALALKDDVAFEKPSTTTAYNEVTLNRTFKAGVWNTICLPFSVSKEQVERVFGKGTVFVGYNGFDGKTLHLVYHAYDYLLPGQPYFIKPTGTGADLNNIVFENVTITSNAAIKDNDGKNDSFEFVGLFNGTKLNTYDHYMNGNGSIAFSSTKQVDLKGYRAYLKNNTGGAAQVKAIAYANFDNDMEEPTSIDGLIEYLESEGVKVVPTGGVYNLSGQKVAEEATNLPAGLYIINGKKVVIK